MPWNTKKVQKDIKQQGGFNCRDTHLHITLLKAYKFNKDWESPTYSQNIWNFAGIAVVILQKSKVGSVYFTVLLSISGWSHYAKVMGKGYVWIPMVRWCPEKIIPSTLSGNLHPPEICGEPIYSIYNWYRGPPCRGNDQLLGCVFGGVIFFDRFETHGDSRTDSAPPFWEKYVYPRLGATVRGGGWTELSSSTCIWIQMSLRTIRNGMVGWFFLVLVNFGTRIDSNTIKRKDKGLFHKLW